MRDLIWARWEGFPAVLVNRDTIPVDAYWLKEGSWIKIHPAVISVNAGLRSKAQLESEFGELPPLPVELRE